jgi:hypothetical protein
MIIYNRGTRQRYIESFGIHQFQLQPTKIQDKRCQQRYRTRGAAEEDRRRLYTTEVHDRGTLNHSVSININFVIRYVPNLSSLTKTKSFFCKLDEWILQAILFYQELLLRTAFCLLFETTLSNDINREEANKDTNTNTNNNNNNNTMPSLFLTSLSGVFFLKRQKTLTLCIRVKIDQNTV